jgi:hypothetical protein
MMDYLYYYPPIERDEDERRRLDAALQTLRASGYTPEDPEDAQGDYWLKRIEATLERLCDDDVSSVSDTLEEIWNNNPTASVKEAVMTLLVTGLQMKKEFLLE